MPDLTVFAAITPKPEYFQDAIRLVESIIAQTRAEPGCYRFDMYTNAGDGQIYLFERWKDQAALDAHYAQSYTQSAFRAYETWLATAPVIYKMTDA